MKVTDHLNNSESTIVSFEILPPLKGKGMKSLFNTLDPLMEFKPPFINVTYHRSEYIYRKVDETSFRKVMIRKRPGTVGICAAIMNHYKVDAVPHLICGGFSKDMTEDALIDLDFLGIDNVLLLRGDAQKSDARFIPEADGNPYALDLVQQVAQMNSGKYLADELTNANPTSFCIGVAGYPEKHFEAANQKTDLKYLKAKVDAGADYIVTQMFFDNSKYFDFVKRVREEGINVPVIPGLKPITTRKQILTLPRTFHVDIPEELEEAISKCDSETSAKEVGIEWCVNQSKELIKNGAPCLHYYTMGKPDTMVRIVKQVL